MYVDFAGDKLEVTDAVTGEISAVEVFVAILPCARKALAQWAADEKQVLAVVVCFDNAGENVAAAFSPSQSAVPRPRSGRRLSERARSAAGEGLGHRHILCPFRTLYDLLPGRWFSVSGTLIGIWRFSSML